MASTGDRACSSTKLAALPTASPWSARPSTRAALTVTASKQARMRCCEVIWATCRPIAATSSMSAEPRLYQGSITQSWPKATLTPWSISSGTRVMPRRLG